MIKAPELDWDRIEATQKNAHYLRSKAAYDIATEIRNAVRPLFQASPVQKSGDASAKNTSFVTRCIEFATARSPLEKGLQAGWY